VNEGLEVDTLANSIGKTLLVRAYKYDGSEHRSWPAQVLRQEGSLIVLDAKFPEEIIHDMLGTIASGTHSLEYYWLDRWYNIFRFAQPDGKLRNYYCNVNVPAILEGDVLSYVDLDIDILVQPDFSYQILDLDEFEKNSALYDYSIDVRQNAQLAVSQLVTMIETRAFPFES
jgi:protein associated with RNAse G/E